MTSETFPANRVAQIFKQQSRWKRNLSEFIEERKSAADLESEVKQLEQKKKELEDELSNLEEPDVPVVLGTKSMHALLSAVKVSQKEVPLSSAKKDKIFKDLIAEIRKKRAEDLLLSYRFFGVTAYPGDSILTAFNSLKTNLLSELSSVHDTEATTEKNAKITLCFDSAFHGKYFESYYLVLEVEHISSESNEKNPSTRMKIFRHTIPHFVPVSTLEEKYLNYDLKKFVSVMQLYLSSFISRREQVKELQQKCENFVHDVEASAAFDLVTFKIKQPESVSDVKLIYESLLSARPSKTLVTHVTTNKKRKRERAAEQEFIGQELCVALQKLVAKSA